MAGGRAGEMRFEAYVGALGRRLEILLSVGFVEAADDLVGPRGVRVLQLTALGLNLLVPGA